MRGGGNDETVSTGCGSPSVLHPWMLLLHMQETALWIPRGAFCPLEGGPRHIGTDTLAPVLHAVSDKLNIDLTPFSDSLTAYCISYCALLKDDALHFIQID